MQAKLFLRPCPFQVPAACCAESSGGLLELCQVRDVRDVTHPKPLQHSCSRDRSSQSAPEKSFRLQSPVLEICGTMMAAARSRAVPLRRLRLKSFRCPGSGWGTGCRVTAAGACRAGGADSPCSASFTWFGLLLPASLAPVPPGSLAESPYRWIFEDFVHVGSVSMGLPGLVSLGIFLNPMFEAMVRIRQAGDVGQMPMLPYSAMASQGVVWTAYGLLLENPAVWTPNLCAAGLGVYYMFVYSKYWQNPGHLLVSHVVKVASTVAFSALACGLPHDWAMNLLGITGNMMTLFMFGGPLAAIRTVVRERNTRALNLGFTCIVNLNCILWFFYAYFMLDDPYIYLQDGLGILLATFQLGLFARYGVQRH